MHRIKFPKNTARMLPLGRGKGQLLRLKSKRLQTTLKRSIKVQGRTKLRDLRSLQKAQTRLILEPLLTQWSTTTLELLEITLLKSVKTHSPLLPFQLLFSSINLSLPTKIATPYRTHKIRLLLRERLQPMQASHNRYNNSSNIRTSSRIRFNSKLT